MTKLGDAIALIISAIALLATAILATAYGSWVIVVAVLIFIALVAIAEGEYHGG